MSITISDKTFDDIIKIIFEAGESKALKEQAIENIEMLNDHVMAVQAELVKAKDERDEALKDREIMHCKYQELLHEKEGK